MNEAFKVFYASCAQDAARLDDGGQYAYVTGVLRAILNNEDLDAVQKVEHAQFMLGQFDKAWEEHHAV